MFKFCCPGTCVDILFILYWNNVFFIGHLCSGTFLSVVVFDRLCSGTLDISCVDIPVSWNTYFGTFFALQESCPGTCFFIFFKFGSHFGTFFSCWCSKISVLLSQLVTSFWNNSQILCFPYSFVFWNAHFRSSELFAFCLSFCSKIETFLLTCSMRFSFCLCRSPSICSPPALPWNILVWWITRALEHGRS